jgi:hypothetical protein
MAASWKEKMKHLHRSGQFGRARRNLHHEWRSPEYDPQGKKH